VLGVQPYRGRLLTTMDDKADAAPAAVIGWRYWQRRFRGASDAIGKVVTINDVRFTIVGVSPPDFAGALEIQESADVTIPVRTDPLVQPTNSSWGKPSLWWLRMMARLQPGVTRAQAQARMETVYQQSVVDSWKADPEMPRRVIAVGTPTVSPRLLLSSGAQGDEFARRRYRRPLELLMTVVGLVLLIACINVASLLIARSSARQQEFAMRTALGASRWRLARQVLTESLVLAAIAGVAGTVAALWTKDLLLEWSVWIRGGAALDASVNGRVIGFTVAISTLTGMLFGLAPALRAGAQRASLTVRAQIGHAGNRMRLGQLLMVLQVAVSLVLLVSAALFLRTLRNLQTVETGFDTRNMLLFRVKPQANGYTDATIGPLYDRMIERLGGIPGVTGVSLSRHPLLSFSHRVNTLWLKPGDPRNGDRLEVNVVSPGFFDTTGMRVAAGRKLLGSDTASSLRVVAVNETFARTYFPGATPIGRQFLMGSGGEGTGNPMRPETMPRPNGSALEIVGVVADAKYTDLRTPVKPTVYQPYLQSPSLQANFEIRYAGNVAAIAPAVRAAVREIDPRLPVFDLRTQAEQREASLGEERMFADLSTAMGGLALVLAAVGLYGVMSYSVRRRTAEIGVRMALGAQRRDVLRMVLSESLTLVTIGVAAGVPVALVGAKAVSAVLADLLYGIRPTDPLSFAFAIGTLLSVAVCAAYAPAMRAARTDPMVALRCE
jgi:predicted permease